MSFCQNIRPGKIDVFYQKYEKNLNSLFTIVNLSYKYLRLYGLLLEQTSLKDFCSLNPKVLLIVRNFVWILITIIIEEYC